VGDKLYGTKSSSGLQLLAYRLEFVCPNTKQAVIVELPSELQFK